MVIPEIYMQATLCTDSEGFIYIFMGVYICMRTKIWGGAWEKLKGEQGEGNDKFSFNSVKCSIL